MNTNKLHYLIALISYPITIMHFIIYYFLNDYTKDMFISGVVFFSIAFLLYVIFVYLSSKNDTGKKLVIVGLLLIGIASIFLAV
ncbi:hypothetical protein F9U64_06725 [Gracilibacillus oryzae]|uniref:Uncharacterized protein n=1 Tax=Gracilibacillus oryzae TaxID=1672701 RepID=A0A7C8KV62_9BACI|nr:hypothetical protein [Gracilibacillus oryzae]KAB8138016.1 hypothetical protein F9U64_06725 [Gracilibacillus oryzae]